MVGVVALLVMWGIEYVLEPREEGTANLMTCNRVRHTKKMSERRSPRVRNMENKILILRFFHCDNQ